MLFQYTSDSDYNSGNNTCSNVWLPVQEGTIITSATIGSQNVASVNGVTPEWSGSVNLNSSSWLAAWSSDGKKIKAMSTSTFATAGHTHDMSTLTGNVINTEPSTNNHKIVFGKSGLDKCEFFEYGGIWNFYKMNGGQSLVASIQSNGFHGDLHGNVSGNVSGSSGSCTGNSATATTAAKLGRSGYTGAPMTFNWSGQSGQPTWLWGSNDGSNIYVWNPSNFSVNWATNAGNGVESSGSGYIRFKCGVQICWGSVSGSTGSVITYGAAFKSDVHVVLTPAQELDDVYFTKAVGTLNFTWGKKGWMNGSHHWVAVGKWK